MLRFAFGLSLFVAAISVGFAEPLGSASSSYDFDGYDENNTTSSLSSSSYSSRENDGYDADSYTSRHDDPEMTDGYYDGNCPWNHVQWEIRSGATRVRGVNLGGWLVSEQWMTAQAPMFHDLPPSVDNKGEFQNGEDHSAPTVSKRAYWSEYASNVKNTLCVAEFLAARYKDDAAFLGLGLLNEPMAQVDEKVLNQYYQDAYRVVRATGSDCVLTFMPLLYKQSADNLVGFMDEPHYKNVWVEWHPYFIWGKKISSWMGRANANKMIFGEWSLASSGQFTDPNTAAFCEWASAMMSVMDQATAGWTYWSWRIYGDDAPGAFNGWSMRSVLNIPELRALLTR